MNDLAKRIAALSPEQRKLFEQRLQQGGKSPLTIPRRQTGNELPLSFDQERIWFFEQLEPNTCLYNIPFAVRLEGTLNAIVLQQSFSAIMQRHESLRTMFRIQDGQPIQVIQTAVDFRLTLTDIGDRPSSASEIESRLRQEAQRPFNLAQEPLLRAVLFQINTTQYVLSVVLHHLIADGWSRGVFIQELAAFYEALNCQMPVSLPELPIQSGDVAVWQRQWIESEAAQQQLAYWQQQLQNLPALNLPIDRTRPSSQTFNGAKLPIQISASLTQTLKIFSQREGATLFMTLLTTFALLLHYYTGQDDVVVGTDVANRNRTETERLIGLFVNQLVLRTDLSGTPTFNQLLKRVRQVTADAYAHQDLPFNKLVEALNPDRDLSRSPLFQVKFVLQNAPVPPLDLPGLVVTPLDEIDTQTATLDLFLTLSETEQGLAGVLEYNTDLFEAATVQRLLTHFQHLLEQVVADPDRPLSEFCLLTAPEWQQLIAWNQTEQQTCLEQGSTLAELFEAQVERTPNAIAAIYESQSLTYQELNQRANQLAHYLQSLGVAPEVLVGIEMERSLELVIGLLGILKAGGAYLPLDPSYPQARLSFMLQDAQVRVLLTQKQNRRKETHCVDLDQDWHHIAPQPDTNLAHTATAENLAYVIYTSGSTGKPKGVMNTHRGICNRLAWMQDAYQLVEGDRVLQKTPISFDVSVWEFFWTLMTGASLVLARPEGHKDSAYLTELIAKQQITTLHFVPPMLRLFLAEQDIDQCGSIKRVSSIKRVICSGEALPLDLQQQFFDRLPMVALHNLYGPTEAAIDVTAYTCQPNYSSATVPIGKAIANTQIYLLNQYLQPVPIGIPGELHIGGMGLARGYLNRPDLTDEKFIPNPFSKSFSIERFSGQCLYKTGDLARYLPDGNIEFLGRIDHQVKLRGFRVELGEIEAILSQHPDVREQVVMVRDGLGESGKQLVAYIVPQAEAAPDLIAQLRDWLKAKLPEYMVPNALIILDALPLTPNGKIDRASIAEQYRRSLPAVTGNHARSSFIPPRTLTEKQLAEIWSKLLGIETVGIHDNFFELGGHSLLATQVTSRVREALGIDVSLRQMFAFPTIAEFAFQVEQTSAISKIPPLQRLVHRHQLPLSFAQQRLWFLHQLAPDDLSYNGAAEIQFQGQLNILALEQSLNAIIQRHEILRTQFTVEEGQPVQVILPTLKLPLSVVDLQEHPSPSDRNQWLQEAIQYRFDLTQAPLFRLTLLRLTDDQHTLLLTLHHIISDAWSIGVFLQELATLYAAFTQGQASPLPELPIQYADFAVWQRQWLQGEVLESQLSYWKQQFQKIPAPPKFAIASSPTGAPANSSQGARHPLALTNNLTTALKSLSQESDVTLFMTLLAGFNALLHYATQQTDIAIGSPIANRNRRENEGLIGFFVNTLVLRTDLSGDPSFRELVLRVREMALEAYAHQDMPFERLVTELQVDRQLGHSPLFQVWFVLQNTPMPAFDLPGLQLTLSDLETGAVRHDLKLDLTETITGLEGFFEYKTTRFEAIAITRLASLYQTLLETVIAQPDIRLSRLIQVLSETEQQQQQQVEQAFRTSQRQKLSQIKRKRY